MTVTPVTTHRLGYIRPNFKPRFGQMFGFGSGGVFAGWMPTRNTTVINNYNGGFGGYDYGYNMMMYPPRRSRFERFMNGLERVMAMVFPFFGGWMQARAQRLEETKAAELAKEQEQKDRHEYELLLKLEKADKLTKPKDIARLEELRSLHHDWALEELEQQVEELNKPGTTTPGTTTPGTTTPGTTTPGTTTSGTTTPGTTTPGKTTPGTTTPGTTTPGTTTSGTTTPGTTTPGTATPGTTTPGATTTGTTTTGAINKHTGERIDLDGKYTLEMRVIKHGLFAAEAYLAAPDGKIYSVAVGKKEGSMGYKGTMLSSMLLKKLEKAGFKPDNITIVDPEHDYCTNKDMDIETAKQSIYKNNKPKQTEHYTLDAEFILRPNNGFVDNTIGCCTPDGKIYTVGDSSLNDEELLKKLYNKVYKAGWQNITINGTSPRDGQDYSYSGEE